MLTEVVLGGCWQYPLNPQEVTSLPSGTARGSPEGVCLHRGCDLPFVLQLHRPQGYRRVVLALWVLYESSTNDSGRKDVMMEDDSLSAFKPPQSPLSVAIL